LWQSQPGDMVSPQSPCLRGSLLFFLFFLLDSQGNGLSSALVECSWETQGPQDRWSAQREDLSVGHTGGEQPAEPCGICPPKACSPHGLEFSGHSCGDSCTPWFPFRSSHLKTVASPSPFSLLPFCPPAQAEEAC
jgi:hypothetical protein